jgi:transposase
MPKIRELTDFERGEIVGLSKGSFSQRNIAKLLDIPKSTVGDVIKKYNEQGLTTTASRSGRPEVLSEHDKRHLMNVAKENRSNTLEELTDNFNTAMNISVSNRTIQRTLHKEGYSGHAAKKNPFISENNRKKRYGWCRIYKYWTTEWDYIIWSDESRFELFNNDSRNWVWRKKDEQYKIDCLKLTVKHSIGVMVWGCFCNNKLGPLVLVEGTLNTDSYIELLKEYLLPFLSDLGTEDYIFQDDNAPCHASHKTKSWKENNSINILPWPAQSPDLNPIESLWNELEIRIRKRRPMPSNKNDFFAALKEEWYKIDENRLIRLVNNMPNRINAVLENKGNPTKY